MFTAVLVAVLALLFAVEAVVEVIRKERVRAAIAANRSRFYRRSMILWWLLTVIWCGIVLHEGRLTRATLGWAGTGTGYADVSAEVAAGFVWAVTGLLPLMALIGGIQARLRGHTQPAPGRDAYDVLLPRTPGERWLAAGVAITAGITEEVIFRGLLIAAGIEVYRLPVVVAAVISLVLFAAVHGYQGTRGILSAASLGLIFTVLYLMSGSILPGIIVHAVQNLVALLLVPAKNAENRTANAEEPTEIGPNPAPAAVPAPLEAAPTAIANLKIRRPTPE